MRRKSTDVTRVVLAIGLAVAVCRLGAASDAPASEPVSAIEVRVAAGEESEAVSDASITSTVNRKLSIGKSDNEGVYRLPLPSDALDNVTVTVTKQGFVPMRWTWRKTSGESAPTLMKFNLETATSIGGIVRDEAGVPIAGATVSLIVPNDGNQQPRQRVYDLKATTDRDGRWHVDVMPASASDIWIRLAHQDFISDEIYNTTPRPPIEQLRDRTGVMVMRRGIAVGGRVLDEQGEPIAGATVRQGHDRFGSHHPETKTDGKGEFRFPQARTGQLVLTVQAAGRSPDIKEVNVANEPIDNIEFRLAPGHTVRGRVVDAEDKPVAGAFVAADTWRQQRSLEWRVDTDSDGRFTWNEAPTDEVLIDVGKQGFMSIRHHRLTPSDEEMTIVLSRPLEIVGRVVDDATDQPIAEFQVIKGQIFANGQGPYWERREVQRRTDGQFTLTFTEPQNELVVRVEALGHAPAVSRRLKPSEGKQQLDFRMKPAADISGVVCDPQGAPVADVEVAMITGQQGIQVTRGRISRSGAGTTKCGADGVFTFPPQSEPYLLIVADERGFVAAPKATFEANHELRMAPWGRLEGRVRLGKLGPTGNLTVSGQSHNTDDSMPKLNFYETGTADAEGRFAFDHLVPGPAHLALTDGGKKTANGMTMTTSLRSVPVEIEAGKTLTANIGGEGLSVAGRVVNDDGSEPNDWSPASGNIQLKSPFEKLPFPENWSSLSPEQKKDWYTAFSESAEGKEFAKQQRLNNRNYPSPIDADGRFRIEAVPPGTYRMSANIFSSGVPNKMIGRVNHEFTVPDTADKSSDQTIDLGTIRIVPFRDLAVGEDAPEIAAECVTGESFALSGLRGKFVLLDFWATWCGPCIGEIPHLREVQEVFGKDDRFMLVSLSLDDERKTAADYVEREKLDWTQVHLGAWSKTETPEKYGVLGIPAVFLIGPDGKVLAKNLRGTAIKTRVAQALGDSAETSNNAKVPDKE